MLFRSSAKILNNLKLSVSYAYLAADHDEIFDQFGFDRSVEQFIKYAKEASDNLKKLRKVRGVTD